MISFGLSGHFRLEVRDAATNALVAVREFDNLITDNGLNSYGRPDNNNVDSCWVGTGTREPTAADTGLESPIEVRGPYWYDNDTRTAATAPDYVCSITKKYRFATGSIVGLISEVLIGGGTTYAGRNVWCRALVKNEQGVLDPVPVASNNLLEVQYTVRVHPQLTDSSFSFDFDGVTYNCVARPAEIQNNLTGWGGASINYGSGIYVDKVYNGGELGPITGNITGANSSQSLNTYYTGRAVAQPYVEGSFYKDFLQPFPLNYANLNGGIDGVRIFWDTVGNYGATGGQFLHATQIKFDKPIMKDSTNSFRLMLRLSWHRWVDPNA